jgi:cobalt-zinc-cadmium efflux system outer membrane protein
MNITPKRTLSRRRSYRSSLIAMLLFFAAPHWLTFSQLLAQQPPKPEMQMQHQHTHAGAQISEIELPRLGRGQQNAKETLFTLENALQAAHENNPTYRQAEVGVKAARFRAQQAGLYPNPIVGYAGDEIRGGEIHGGKQGFFVEQTIVTAGKLSRSRIVAEKDIKIAEIAAEQQQLRVETAIKATFYRVLAAQELRDSRADLAKIANEVAETEQHLQNTGQADESEVLAAQLDSHRKKLSVRMEEFSVREAWRTLAAVMGKPDLPQQTVVGDLEHGWPSFDGEEVVTAILANSPEISAASVAAERADAEIANASSAKSPDIRVRAGLEYNHELLNNLPLATGWEGTAEIGLQIPIFNRNQGNIAAAGAEKLSAEAEKQRISLSLQTRAAMAIERFANARIMAEQYRDDILPLAKKAYVLMSDRHGEMLAALPRVLESKQKLFELQREYIGALAELWESGLALQGYLPAGGLDAPRPNGDLNMTPLSYPVNVPSH